MQIFKKKEEEQPKADKPISRSEELKKEFIILEKQKGSFEKELQNINIKMIELRGAYQEALKNENK